MEQKEKHVETITLSAYGKMLDGGCGECKTSCQSACKTSCTVSNQECEK